MVSTLAPQLTAASAPPPGEARSEAAQLRALRGVFLAIDSIRSTLDLDVEEALLYLGIGYLNTERIQHMGVRGYIAATNISSVADFMNLPRETARRKIKRLIQLGLVESNRGVVVADISRWFSFVDQIPLAARADADRR
jgi:hypothetical protein